MLKGGVFGFGSVGQMMTKQLNVQKVLGDDARIVAVCNRGQEKRDLAEKEYGLTAYEKMEDLIGHGLDFMLILSQSHVHKDAALQCADAKLPYLIEKPIALNVQDALEIVEATEKAGLINGVNYSMRYSPVYRKMKEMADEGVLGEILSVYARSFRGFGFHSSGHRHRAITEPEESGGWIVHHMCHVVDFCVWIGGEVEDVFCVTRSTAPEALQAEEINWSTVRFKNKAVGSIADQIGMMRDHASGVIGSKASVAELRNIVKPMLKFSLETDIQFAPPRIIDPTESIKPESGLTQFLRCLKKGEPTSVPVREAWYSLKVCHALRVSSREGRPVRVDDIS